MTTDLELNRKLALAIGWREDQLSEAYNFPYNLYIKINPTSFRYFDYGCWNIIGPIAARYGLVVDFGKNYVHCNRRTLGVGADTPQKAIALAVIGAGK